MGKSGQIWAKWDDERRNNALILLFEKDAQKRTTSSSNMVTQFGTHLEGWRKMREQLRIEHFVLTRDPIKALNELKAIVSNWSRGEAKLLEIGSLMLGTNTATSDVDIIYIVPQKTTKSEAMDKFFGTFQCDLSQRKCEDNSLYCLLCLNEKVAFLQKLSKAYIPLIKTHFLGFDFDILFVSVPTIKALPAEEPMAQNEVMELIRKLANQTDPDEKMIKSLAGHITNDHIKRLLGKKMLKKFRKLVVILKFWAKSNFIYGTPFGFFNGISLSVMAAKVSLLYPNCSVPFLLNRFLLTFATWNWPIPLRLVEYLPNEFQKFSWTPKDEEKKRNSTLLMPIITPGCLEQNAMFHMNESTFKIVQKSMREAFIKIQSPNENNWSQLFAPPKFTKKYKHYAAICCVVGNLIHLAQFCDFVERKIRLQLLHFDTVTDGVNFTHIMTENDREFKCPNSILVPVLKQNRNFSLHKAWLLGIEMEEKTAEQKQNSPSENKEDAFNRFRWFRNMSKRRNWKISE
ncbi:hypothetical protein niasHT_036076 [Heterodera trifolii]|uniref:polynucleotide adenylyltransferase n=1 Tax=Heterodera trifolii TaxID=157864 RepID=A0ABD2IEU1_9BILA